MDSRVDLTATGYEVSHSRRKFAFEPDHNENALWYAAREGQLEIIKWWIASGRDMDLGRPETPSSAVEVAENGGKREVVALLERFMRNPEDTRREIMDELGINGKYLTSFFEYPLPPPPPLITSLHDICRFHRDCSTKAYLGAVCGLSGFPSLPPFVFLLFM